MPSIDLYTQTGEKAGKLKLDDSVFGAERNDALIHQVVTAQRNNARQGTKSTLTRTEVRGGGIKPWRQKGTGRARQGSIRSPQWTGGGVVFAPKPRDFSQKVNKSAKEAAFKSAISAKVADGEVKVVSELKLAAAKTKEMIAVLEALKLEKGSVLLVIGENDTDIIRASGNIPNVTTVSSRVVSVYDIVSHSVVMTTKAAVKDIEEAHKA